MTILPAGTKAPDFKLSATPDQKVSLSDFKGVPVVLVFYPADWSPVCSDELTVLNEMVEDFKKGFNAEVIGISVDGVWCHFAFAQQHKFHFPLLADFEPKGQVAKSYGAFQSDEGLCERALFVIDGDGVIQWSYLSPVGINPGVDGVLQALEKLPKKTTSKK